TPRRGRRARRRAGAPGGAPRPTPPSRAPGSRTSRCGRRSPPRRSPRPPPSPSPRASGSAIEVERELRRMRAQPHGVDLVLALVRDPGPDQALVEDAVLREELVVVLQRVERLVQRAGHLRDAAVVLEEV